MLSKIWELLKNIYVRIVIISFIMLSFFLPIYWGLKEGKNIDLSQKILGNNPIQTMRIIVWVDVCIWALPLLIIVIKMFIDDIACVIRRKRENR